MERAHLLGRQQAVDPVDGGVRALRRRHLQISLERHVLEQAAHHVEDLVGLELLADRLQLVEQRLQHPALARLAGDEVDDDHRIVPLPVAVDAAHALLEAGRVPGHVVVHHEPAELQVDALARGVGRDQVVGAAVAERTAEQIHLRLALAVVEAAVDRRHLAGEPQPLEATDQELAGVAMLGEHDELLAGERRVAQHAAQLLELRVLAVFGQTPCPGEQRLHLDALSLRERLERSSRSCARAGATMPPRARSSNASWPSPSRDSSASSSAVRVSKKSGVVARRFCLRSSSSTRPARTRSIASSSRPRRRSNEEAERRQAEHPLVDGDALVGQRIDQRDLGREGGVEEVAVGCELVPAVHAVSNCRAERFSLADRFERWSISTPTTSFDSL